MVLETKILNLLCILAKKNLGSLDWMSDNNSMIQKNEVLDTKIPINGCTEAVVLALRAPVLFPSL